MPDAAPPPAPADPMASGPQAGRWSPRSVRLLAGGSLVAWLAVIFCLALPMALERHFQVDELQNVYDARLAALGGAESAARNLKPWTMALGRLGRHCSDTRGILLTARGAFFALFVLNLLLLAWAQPTYRSWTGRAFVLLAFTFSYPLWKFGFEIRHDVLLLTCQLGLYALCLTAVRGRRQPWVFLAAGALAGWMVLTTLKGLVFAVPQAAILLLVAVPEPWRAPIRRRVVPALLVLGGAALAFAAGLAILAAVGGVGRNFAAIRGFVGGLGGLKTFSPNPGLLREAMLSPVPHALALAALGYVAADVASTRLRELSPTIVTGAFLLVAFTALQLNPTPFPYNLVAWTPFVLLAALEAWSRLPMDRTHPGILALVLLSLVGSWGYSYGYSRFGTKTNETQLSYAAAAEALTAPDQPVLDGVGLVPSRPPAHRDWLVHSSLRPAYRSGQRRGFDHIMKDVAPPVVITGYRWRWIPSKHRRVRDRMYHRLARNFWVLGGTVTGPKATLSVRRAGRYRIGKGRTPWPGPMSLDGEPVRAGDVAELSVGQHTLSGVPSGWKLVWHWLGPDLDEAPKLVPLGKRQPLFLNELR